MPKILLVEDEKNFALVLKDYLGLNGFEVRHCENGQEGLEVFRKESFDLCILDIMMPKKDGFSLSGEIKALNKDIPLLFLTARAMRDDMIKAYRLGAEDYVVKPFDSELLLYKIRAILKRSGPKAGFEPELHRLGQFEFNYKLRMLRHDSGESHKLSPYEAELLHLLCLHKNDVLPREKALKRIWKEETYFTGRSMDVYLVKLRKYLLADPGLEINSLHGNGFSLVEKEI
ncbi:MAG TPA: response regulator transcription factor [Bacteroidia bacterium]|nr:response regulator transcription factor [Bacteroidia bacterium]